MAESTYHDGAGFNRAYLSPPDLGVPAEKIEWNLGIKVAIGALVTIMAIDAALGVDKVIDLIHNIH